MTVPHLMNCPHSDDGWCLDCVAELGNENWRLREALGEIDCAIASAGAHDVTAREWAHDMDVAQHIARKALDPSRPDGVVA